MEHFCYFKKIVLANLYSVFSPKPTEYMSADFSDDEDEEEYMLGFANAPARGPAALLRHQYPSKLGGRPVCVAGFNQAAGSADACFANMLTRFPSTTSVGMVGPCEPPHPRPALMSSHQPAIELLAASETQLTV